MKQTSAKTRNVRGACNNTDYVERDITMDSHVIPGRPALRPQRYQQAALIGGASGILDALTAALTQINGVTVTHGMPSGPADVMYVVNYPTLAGEECLLIPGRQAPPHLLINVPVDTAIEIDLVARGVRGVTFENQCLHEVVKGVLHTLRGGYWFPRRVIDEWFDRLHTNYQDIARFGLTAREQEIIALVLAGYSGKEIGAKLGISPCTVRTHLHSIFRKTGARSRMDLTRLMVPLVRVASTK